MYWCKESANRVGPWRLEIAPDLWVDTAADTTRGMLNHLLATFRTRVILLAANQNRIVGSPSVN